MKSSFDFWQRWMVNFNLMIVCFGVIIVFFGESLLFHFWHELSKEVFFDGNEIYDLYFFCSIAGALGATVSALQRINKISFDIYSSKTSLYIESLNRIIIGIVFSLFLLMAIKSGIVFSNYSGNIYAIISLAFIGGFSERFVPSIIANVDKEKE